jgi:hypothetical protein
LKNVWTSETNENNPDTTYPWSWDFDFPKEAGYYEFHSIGKKNGETELPPETADARCFFKPNTPPYTPSNPSPGNGSAENSIDLTLHWTGGDPDAYDTVTYDVYFGMTNPPQKIISNQSNTYYQADILNYNMTYYWKVVSWDNKGASSSGPIWSFTTVQTQQFVLSFIVGRITNTNMYENVITFDAVNTWEITFLPIQILKCPQDDRIMIGKNYLGFLGTRFIFAFCKVSLP